MGNSMGGVWLVAMIVLSYLAISTAKGSKWRLINLAIIIGAATFGFGLGAAAGAWGRNMEIGGMIAVTLATWFGITAALGCWRRNKLRDNASDTPSISRQNKLG